MAHDPVHRHFFTRPHDDDITDADLLNRDVLLAAIADNPRVFRLQADQCPDRLGGAPFRPHLHQASEQNQCDDRGRGVEVHGRSQVAGRKELRSQSGEQAVQVRCRSSDCDEGVHVGGAMTGDRVGSLVELPAGPELNGRGQEKL